MDFNRGVKACCLLLSILITGCASESETVVNDIPESENLFFTPDGRLFVSGGESVFEIIQNSDGTYQKLDIFHDNCLVEGIIQRYDYIYAVCSKTNLLELAKSYLLAAAISQHAPTEDDIEEVGVHPFMDMQVINDLADLGVPNGMEVDEYGNVYIADSGKSDIVRVSFSSPEVVSSIDIWSKNTALFVNGLEWVGDELYFTGIKNGTLRSVFGKLQRNPDGSAGEPIILYERFGTVLDDIAAYGSGILITDYVRGSLLLWQEGEVVAETDADTFFAPTAVQPGQPPMFSEDALLVTEKGIIFNRNPAWGNKLGLFYPPF